MINTAIYNHINSIYDDMLCRICNKMSAKLGARIWGDVPPDLTMELENTLQNLTQITKQIIRGNIPCDATTIFYDTENDEFISINELKSIWNSEPDLIETYENFYRYVNACQTHNNGTLIKIN